MDRLSAKAQARQSGAFDGEPRLHNSGDQKLFFSDEVQFNAKETCVSCPFSKSIESFV